MDPQITAIVPASVVHGWVGTLRVYGAGFNSNSAVMIEASFPRTKYIDQGIVEAEMETAQTSSAGPKAVKIHQLDTGSLSNEVTLLIK